jgi:hypothetical protein
VTAPPAAGSAAASARRSAAARGSVMDRERPEGASEAWAAPAGSGRLTGLAEVAAVLVRLAGWAAVRVAPAGSGLVRLAGWAEVAGLVRVAAWAADGTIPAEAERSAKLSGIPLGLEAEHWGKLAATLAGMQAEGGAGPTPEPAVWVKDGARQGAGLRREVRAKVAPTPGAGTMRGWAAVVALAAGRRAEHRPAAKALAAAMGAAPVLRMALADAEKRRAAAAEALPGAAATRVSAPLVRTAGALSEMSEALRARRGTKVRIWAGGQPPAAPRRAAAAQRAARRE